MVMMSRTVGVGLVLLGLPAVTADEPKARPLVAAFYPEGPCFHKNKLYYVEYSAHNVMVWDGRNAKTVWHKDGMGPAAILRLNDGTFLVTCYDKHRLVRLNKKGKEVETIKEAIKWPNDLAMDGRGGVYISSSGEYDKDAPVEGKVYYRTPEGRVTLVAEGIHYANGVAVTEGGKALLVAEHLKNRVLRYTIGECGKLSDGKVWQKLSDIRPDPPGADWSLGPDGLKVDSHGNVYICQN